MEEITDTLRYILNRFRKLEPKLKNDRNFEHLIYQFELVMIKLEKLETLESLRRK